MQWTAFQGKPGNTLSSDCHMSPPMAFSIHFSCQDYFFLLLKSSSVTESQVWFQGRDIFFFLSESGELLQFFQAMSDSPFMRWGLHLSLPHSGADTEDAHVRRKGNVVLLLARIEEPSTGNRLPFAPWQIVLKAWQHQIHHKDWPAPSFCQLNRCGSSHNVNKGYVLLQRKRGQNTI